MRHACMQSIVTCDATLGKHHIHVVTLYTCKTMINYDVLEQTPVSTYELFQYESIV